MCSRYLLLGRVILEAGVLDVIGPDGLVLFILRAQVLHSLGDGEPAALDVFTADPAKWAMRVGSRGSELPPAHPGCCSLTCPPESQDKAAQAHLENAPVEHLLQRRKKAHPMVNTQ